MHGVKTIGLASAEAARRLLQDGPNTLPASRPRNTLAIAVEVVRDGVAQRSAGAHAVRGGLLILSEGNRVPTDAVLHSVAGLWVD